MRALMREYHAKLGGRQVGNISRGEQYNLMKQAAEQGIRNGPRDAETGHSDNPECASNFLSYLKKRGIRQRPRSSYTLPQQNQRPTEATHADYYCDRPEREERRYQRWQRGGEGSL